MPLTQSGIRKYIAIRSNKNFLAFRADGQDTKANYTQSGLSGF